MGKGAFNKMQRLAAYVVVEEFGRHLHGDGWDLMVKESEAD